MKKKDRKRERKIRMLILKKMLSYIHEYASPAGAAVSVMQTAAAMGLINGNSEKTKRQISQLFRLYKASNND